MRLHILPLLFCATAAFGLNTRSAVSINGLDSNPCSVASPCRSFPVAIAATSSGGEVVALDTAGYGPFTVTMPMVISGAPGVHAAITVSSADGITVNAGASDTVILRNLTLIGLGGARAIVDTASKELTVIGCSISGFTNAGISVQPTATNVSVNNSSIFDNASVGIDQVAGGSGHRIVVSSSLLHFNQIGVHITQAGSLVATDSTFSGNLNYGVYADAAAGNCSVTLKRSVFVGNLYGIWVASANMNVATAWLSQDVFAYNEYGVFNSGVTNTYGNNRFDFNLAGDTFGTGMAAAALH